MIVSAKSLTSWPIVARACVLGLAGAIWAGIGVYRQSEPNFNDPAELAVAAREVSEMKEQPREGWRMTGQSLSMHNQRVINVRLLEGLTPEERKALRDPTLREFALSSIKGPRLVAVRAWGIAVAVAVGVAAFPLTGSVVWLVLVLFAIRRLPEPCLRLEKTSPEP